MVCSRKCNIFLRDGNSECASSRIGYQERNTEIFQGRTSGEDFIERTLALDTSIIIDGYQKSSWIVPVFLVSTSGLIFAAGRV